MVVRRGRRDYYATETGDRGFAEAATIAQQQAQANLLSMRGAEGWRLVGGSGQPAFANSWVNYGSPYLDAAFYKDVLAGRVYFRGIIKSGTLTSSAFTLPAGYCPEGLLLISTWSNGDAPCALYVNANGTVVPQTGNNTAVALDGLSFRVA